MPIWDKVKDSLSKTFTEVEEKASQLKDTVHSEIEFHKLKSSLEELRKEELEVYQDMGQKLSQLFTTSDSVKKSSFQNQMDYLQGMGKKIDDLQSKINEFYEESPKEKKSDEIIIEEDSDKEKGKD